MNHSILSPSSAGTWGKPHGCTGSVRMVLAFPETEGEDAKEGTITHDIAETALCGIRCGREPMWHPGVGKIRDGICVSQEMHDSAKTFVDDVRRVWETRKGKVYFGTEGRVQAKFIHELLWGTCDCYIYDPKENVLYIWDFKHGHGVIEVFKNWQMLCYAAGLVELFGIDTNITIRFRMVQPRAFHSAGTVREWKTDLMSLSTYFATLGANAIESLGPDAVTRSGVHCRNCTARHACKAAIDGGVSLYETATAPTIIDMTPEALGIQLGIVQRAFAHLDYLKTGLSEEAESLIRSGTAVPGYILESTKGREAWTEGNDVIGFMGDALGIDLRKGDVVTPNQARKAGVSKEAVAALSERRGTSLKLTADDGSKAMHVFSN